jgi:hypothetical protein
VPSTPRARGAWFLSADDLATWTNRYPGYVLRWTAPNGEGDFVPLEIWGPNVTDATRNFVPVGPWDSVAAEMRRHVLFAEEPPTVVFSLQGEAGVGKSRLVYEVLRDIPGMPGLVLYANDEDSAVR